MIILNSMLKGFLGGIHLLENKFTENLAIEVMPAPKRVYISLTQHAGKPAKPVVQKDDFVKIGTKIGESEGFISASVHASISGKVLDIKQHPHPVLASAKCCIIESDETEDWAAGMKEKHDYENLPKEELLSIIKDAGIVGLGGAAFPTHVKLSPPPDKPIEYLLINGCECEPRLTADHRLMLEYPIGIIEGAKLFQQILNTKHLIFCIEDNKKEAAKIFISENEDVRVLKTKYPQGAEKQLIKAVLNRTVPRGGLPMDVGCVVQNVGTCYAAFQAVKFRKPLIDRIVTVTGDGVKESKNLLIRIGTSVIDVVNFCGGFVDQPKRIIFGGPMMGISQYAEDVPIIKGTSGILVSKEVSSYEEGPCVRCGCCVDVCPMGLMPTEIYKLVKNKKFLKSKDYGVLDCIECGCCAYGCPSKIPLVHYLKYGKNEVWRLSKK